MRSANPGAPIRVLHVVHNLERGGIETDVLNILRCTNRRLIECDVCVVGREPGSRVNEAEQLAARVLSCPLDASKLVPGIKDEGIVLENLAVAP